MEIEGEGGAMEESLGETPLSILRSLCSQEIENYRSGDWSDDRYCLEIFRRAIVDHEEEAWAALQEQFREKVVCWLRAHSKSALALQIEPEQNYVDDTFKRLWQWAHNQRVELNALADFHGLVGFRSLPGAFAFLHGCLNSVIMDNMRTHARQQRMPFPEYDLPAPSSHEEHLLVRELWQVVQTILTDEREYRAIFLRYHEGLKAQEILLRCPGEFLNSKEIYRLTRNALERLRRHSDILRWKLGYEEEA